jgi:hypothetical protein
MSVTLAERPLTPARSYADEGRSTTSSHARQQALYRAEDRGTVRVRKIQGTLLSPS